MRIIFLPLLLFQVSHSLTSLQEDRLARELEDCRKQVELQEDHSNLDRVCSRLVSITDSGTTHISRPA